MIITRNEMTLNEYLCRSSAVIFFLMILLTPSQVQADAAREIEHLLSYIKRSGCIFMRNGKEHTSTEAKDHIQKKYAYAQRRIKTTEDFIRFAATRSSMSGAPYKVRCDRKETFTAEWLEAELRNLRAR